MNSLYNRISNEFRTSLTYSMTPTSITNYNNKDNLLRKLWLSNCISSIRHNNNNNGSYLINYNKKKPTNYRTKTSLDPLNNFSYGGSMKNLFNSNIHTDFETDLNLNVKWDFQINANYDNIKSQWNKSIRSSETETVHEQKSHFGNNPNLKFTFSNLIELCDLAGLHISEYDISSCIIKSEFHEHYTESNTFKSSIQQKAYFVKLYEIHCEQVYTAVINIQIENLQTIWHRFWCSSESTTCTSECSLPKSYLIELCDDSKICQFIELADRTLYQILLDIIINDSLKTLCNDLLQALQTMIKLMEAYLQSAIRHFNPQLINRKLSAVACFIKGLHRAMSISCFSHTVGNIINDTQKCEQILSDIDKLDLKCIEAQGSWASDCLLYGLIQNSFCSSLIVHNSGKSSSKKGIKEEPSDQLSSLSTLKSSGYTENFISLTREMFSSEKYLYNDDDNSYYGADIKVLHSEMCNLLMNKSSLTMWTRWLDNIVTRSLVNSPSGPKRASAARQLMLVWTYYSSLLMRELTLRSAISFSNCHLLRMLCDEYLSYRLEQVASSPLTTLPKLFNETPSTPLYPNKNDSNTNIDCFQITTEHLEGYENLPTSTVNNIISLKSYPSNNEISNQHENICNKHLSGKNLTSYSTATTTHNEISSRNSITEDNDDGDIFMENSNTTLLLSSINSDNYLEYIDTQILSNHDDIELVDEDDVDNDALCNALSPNCLLQRNTTNTDNLLFNMNGSDDITSVNTSVDSHDDHSHLQRGVVDEHTPSHMVVTRSKDSSDSDRPNNYFSFGFSNDPILTETTQFNDPDDDYAKSTLLNDGIIDIDHSKYWSCRQHPSTHHYSPKKSLETLNRSSFVL
ncbi:unnamed protein product [Heterobilharzia americana]|nr:unnamed protein product [Heterobilharzia americana]